MTFSQNINHIRKTIGESLEFVIQQKSGEFSDVTSVSGSLVNVNNDYDIPDSPTTSLSFTVTPNETDSNWYLSLESGQTAVLSAGRYVFDAKISFGVSTVYTDRVYVDFEKGVS